MPQKYSSKAQGRATAFPLYSNASIVCSPTFRPIVGRLFDTTFVRPFPTAFHRLSADLLRGSTVFFCFGSAFGGIVVSQLGIYRCALESVRVSRGRTKHRTKNGASQRSHRKREQESESGWCREQWPKHHSGQERKAKGETGLSPWFSAKQQRRPPLYSNQECNFNE